MVEKRYAVVTGANKGIGLEICRQLAFNGVSVILTARDELRGKKAVDNLIASGILDGVIFHQLDVKDPESVSSLANFIEKEFGKLDILVNNAGYIGVKLDWKVIIPMTRAGLLIDENVHMFKGLLEESYENAEECVRINYYGTKRVTQALLPLLQMSESARIVNVTSNGGALVHINNEKFKAEMKNVAELTVEKVDEYVELFLRDFKENKLQANSWPLTFSGYRISKAAMNDYTRIIAKNYPSFKVNCVHPGFVRTDMTGNAADITVEEGARGPVMAALLPDDAPSGVYFDQINLSTF